MRAQLSNGVFYNPNRKIPTRAQGDTISPRPTGIRSKGTIDLHTVIYWQVSMASPTLLRLLKRLYLELKHEGDNWNLYRGDLLLFSSKNSREVLDWLLKVYVTGLLATDTVPPPPLEDPEKVWRRRVRANQKAKRQAKQARR